MEKQEYKKLSKKLIPHINALTEAVKDLNLEGVTTLGFSQDGYYQFEAKFEGATFELIHSVGCEKDPVMRITEEIKAGK